MITYLTLLLAIPTGIILYLLTKKEKEIYSKSPYFPIMLWVFAILSAIFLSINKQIALPLIFIFLTILTWQKMPFKK